MIKYIEDTSKVVYTNRVIMITLQEMKKIAGVLRAFRRLLNINKSNKSEPF